MAFLPLVRRAGQAHDAGMNLFSSALVEHRLAEDRRQARRWRPARRSLPTPATPPSRPRPLVPWRHGRPCSTCPA